jgi:AAA domain
MRPDENADHFTEIRDEPYSKDVNGNGGPSHIPFLTKAAFLKGFVPPEYLVEGVLQRRFIYALTAMTSAGKTALALALAQAIGCEDPNARFGCHAVEKGKVLYMVGENADDVRARVIAADALRKDDPSKDQIYFIAGVFSITELRTRIEIEADKLGGLDLIIVDTSAAYFFGDDENNNKQAGDYARMLRSLTKVRGGPCVVALCHPTKHVKHADELLPRGGGAFLNEIDGNMTAWRTDTVVELSHSDKWRGPGFEAMSFRIEKFTTPKLVDAKGRLIPTVRAVAISEAEEAEESRRTHDDEDRLLIALSKNHQRSHADLARACDFYFDNGEPAKSRLQRTLRRLQQARLIKPDRDYWTLSKDGQDAVDKISEANAETIDDRGGANSKKPFHALRGMKQRESIPCVFCGQTGDVYKFADGRLPKGERHHADLHEGCAKDFFTGKPSPKSKPEAHLN